MTTPADNLDVSKLSREQLEDAYRHVSWVLTRILKRDGVTMIPDQVNSHAIFIIREDPKPGDYRIWYTTSGEGTDEVKTIVEVRPYP